MLADQFAAAAAAARNTHAVDEIARLTWRAHAEGQLIDADAEAVSEALQARRAAFATRRTTSPSRPLFLRPYRRGARHARRGRVFAKSPAMGALARKGRQSARHAQPL